MGYVTLLSSTMPVITDSSGMAVSAPGMSRGLVPRDYAKHPYGSSPVCGPATINKIPRSEWDDRLELMDKNKSSLWDICDARGIPVKYQNGISFCWIHGGVHCVEVVLGSMGLPVVPLSATSVGCKIKNFRNQGGWGQEGIEYVAEHGVVPQDLWPENKLERSYDTPAAWERAKDFKITEWDELENRDFDMLMSYLFHGIPVALGLDWWGHLITAMRPVAISPGKYGVGIDNSWGPSWGDNGRGVLVESKARGDGTAPRVVVATA